MKLIAALSLFLTLPTAHASDSDVHQSIVSGVQIYSVNDLEIVSQKAPKEEGYDAGFNAYLHVTAEGNICTADFVASRVHYAGNKMEGTRIKDFYDVSLEAVDGVDFDSPLMGCTASGEIKKMRIALAVRDISSRYVRSRVYRIPYQGVFGGKAGVATLTITLDKGGWRVEKEGFAPSIFDQRPDGPVVPAPKGPIDFDDIGKGRPRRSDES
jgi:hypothetical protein